MIFIILLFLKGKNHKKRGETISFFDRPLLNLISDVSKLITVFNWWGCCEEVWNYHHHEITGVRAHIPFLILWGFVFWTRLGNSNYHWHFNWCCTANGCHNSYVRTWYRAVHSVKLSFRQYRKCRCRAPFIARNPTWAQRDLVHHHLYCLCVKYTP